MEGQPGRPPRATDPPPWLRRVSGSVRIERMTNCRTTSGSMAAPPASMRSNASRNSSTWATRSLSTVLEALAQGHTNTAVAQQLHISLSSVEKEA